MKPFGLRDRLMFAGIGLVAGILVIIGGRSLASLVSPPPDRDDIFTYHSVEFVGLEPDGSGLVMLSTRTYHADIDSIVWTDRLRCGGRTFSTLVTSGAGIEERPVHSAEWTYTGAYPSDSRSCVIDSTIQATVGDRTYTQRLTTEAPFQPGEAEAR